MTVRNCVILAAIGLTYAWGCLPIACAQDRPATEGDITIVQTEWGFDGKAPARTFVPLSVLIQNNGPNPASGTLRLSKSFGMKRKIDADLEQTYFVSGFSSRWVQLTPYVLGDFESWELTWGPRQANRIDVPTPRAGTGATVLFADPDDTSATGSALRRCDPALFPVSVTATDSLRGAVLHSVPDWQGARLQAFREWLQRGGRVFLVYAANGEYPRFGGELSFLNDPRESYAVGRGRVTHVPMSVDDLDAETVRTQLLAAEPRKTPELLAEQMLAASRGGMMPVWTNFDDFILRELHALTKFYRNWWLIYGFAVLYLLAVFPGSYLLGRRAADWRWFYAGFLGIAVIFSAGFTKLGELGSADRTRSRSIGIAYQIDDGLFDYSQWTCIASRNGDLYALSNAGSGRLFSSCQEIEAVNGVVRQQDGTFDVDLPPASTCNVVSRARLPGPSLDVQVAGLQVSDRGLEALDVKFSGTVRHRSMIVSAWHNRKVYELTLDSTGAHLSGAEANGASFIDTIGTTPFQEPSSFDRWGNYIDDPVTTTEAFHFLMHQAVGTTLNLPGGTAEEDVVLDPSIVRLLIYSPLPEEFEFTGDQIPDQQGFVLYVVDLPTNGGAP